WSWDRVLHFTATPWRVLCRGTASEQQKTPNAVHGGVCAYSTTRCRREALGNYYELTHVGHDSPAARPRTPRRDPVMKPVHRVPYCKIFAVRFVGTRPRVRGPARNEPCPEARSGRSGPHQHRSRARMHIPDGFLTTPACVAGGVIAAGGLAIAL